MGMTGGISRPMGVLVSCDRPADWLADLKQVPPAEEQISTFTQRKQLNRIMRDRKKDIMREGKVEVDKNVEGKRILF